MTSIRSYIRKINLSEINFVEVATNSLNQIIAINQGFIWKKNRANHDENKLNSSFKSFLCSGGYSYLAINSYIQFLKLVENFPRVLVSNIFFRVLYIWKNSCSRRLKGTNNWHQGVVMNSELFKSISPF